MSAAPLVSPVTAALTATCPRCGRGPLFEGFLTVRPSCTACGLDLQKAEQADGPAVFAIFIIGTLAVAAAFLLRFAAGLPIAVAFFGSVLLTLGLTAAIMRPLKALLIALQYQTRANDVTGGTRNNGSLGEINPPNSSTGPRPAVKSHQPEPARTPGDGPHE